MIKAILFDLGNTLAAYYRRNEFKPILGASRAGFNTVWLERHLEWPADHPFCFDLKANQVRDLGISFFTT